MRFSVRLMVVVRWDGASERFATVQQAHVSRLRSTKLFVNRSRKSGREVVSMMQTAESRHGNDLRARRGVLRSFSVRRRLLVQPEVGSVLVVIADVFVHPPSQMALIQDDHMVEQIAAASAYESLGHAVLPGLWKLVRLGSMPKLLIVSTTSVLKLAPQSKIRYFGAISYGNASRNC